MSGQPGTVPGHTRVASLRSTGPPQPSANRPAARRPHPTARPMRPHRPRIRWARGEGVRSARWLAGQVLVARGWRRRHQAMPSSPGTGCAAARGSGTAAAVKPIAPPAHDAGVDQVEDERSVRAAHQAVQCGRQGADVQVAPPWLELLLACPAHPARPARCAASGPCTPFIWAPCTVKPALPACARAHRRRPRHHPPLRLLPNAGRSSRCRACCRRSPAARRRRLCLRRDRQ